MPNLTIRCNRCLKPVKRNQKGISCHICNFRVHTKCAELSVADFNNVNNSTDWFCVSCLETIFPFNHIIDDVEFMACCRSLSCDKYSGNSPLLRNYSNLPTFNPFEADVNRFLLNNENLDPDVSYYNELKLPDSAYSLATELSPLYSDPVTSQNKPFSIIHANCRGINKSFENIINTVDELNFKVSVIAVTETWTTVATENLYQITGYNPVFKSRNAVNLGGGVGIFILDSIPFVVRDDLCSSDNCIETLFIELLHDNVIVGCVYRPPGLDVNEFTAYIETLFSKISKEHKTSFIAGDFNIDLLKTDSHVPTTSYVNCLFSHGFFPVINRPTRIAETSATLIDNILVNKLSMKLSSAILFADISDHFPVVVQSDIHVKTSSPPPFTYKRIMSDRAKECFTEALQTYDWNHLCGSYSFDTSDPSIQYDIFINKFKALFDSNFPLVKVNHTRKRSPRKAWMTKGLVRSCMHKEKLYKQFKINPTSENRALYVKYKNKLHKLLRKAENNYYENKFDSIKSSTRQTWSLIKTLLNNNNNNNILDKIKINNNLSYDKNEIVNEFNKYFVNIGPNVAKSCPSICKPEYSRYLKGDFVNSFSLFFTTPEEICSVVASMPPKTSVGHDDISMEVIKIATPYIAKPLSIIINNSFSSGNVPAQLKIAKVVPLYKSGDRCVLTNYRPISILPGFSKIFEKLVFNRLMKYLTDKDILYKYQFGFRPQHDTTLAVIDMVDRITAAIDAKKYSLGIFVDLSKAFDTINHRILLDKLYHYGIRGLAHSWFQSYLHNRSQYVELGEHKSGLLPILCGVPQGSILGPLLFLIYINDIANVSELLHLILYADDTNIFLSDSKIENLICTANNELNKLDHWFQANCLSVNLSKCNYIVFCSPKLKYSFSIKIKINNTEIEQVHFVKFLGVYIDEHLNWSQHIQTITSKISKNNGVLNKLRNRLPSNVMLLLYNSLILPYLSYCNCLWGAAGLSKLHTLAVNQKRTIRLIAKAPIKFSTSPLFKKFNILKIDELHSFLVLIFMFKYSHNLLPPSFANYFVPVNNVHYHNTRQSNDYFLTFARTNLRKHNIKFTGSKLWNSLPAELKTCSSIASFKRKLKRHYSRNY